MANETLSIQKDDARLTVIGKSKADTYIDSGLGFDLDDLDIGSLDPFDLNWQTDVPDPDNLPDEIRIITPPTKTKYQSGKKIDLSGAVVGAYKNGSIWTSSKYPNGHIPLGELIITPLITDISEAGDIEYEENGIVSVALDCSTKRSGSYQLGYYYYPEPYATKPNYYRFVGRDSPGTLYLSRHRNYLYVACTDDYPVKFTGYGGTDPSGETATGRTIGEVKLTKGEFSYFLALTTDASSIAPVNEISPTTVNYSEPECLGALEIISIQWARPHDAELLSTTLDLHIIPGGGGR